MPSPIRKNGSDVGPFAPTPRQNGHTHQHARQAHAHTHTHPQGQGATELQTFAIPSLARLLSIPDCSFSLSCWNKEQNEAKIKMGKTYEISILSNSEHRQKLSPKAGHLTPVHTHLLHAQALENKHRRRHRHTHTQQ